MRLAWRLLRQDWQSGELRLIVVALIMSVTVVTSVTLLADRVEKGLVEQSSALLAGDLSVRGSRDIDSEFQNRAVEQGLETSWGASFASMVFSGDNNHLASVRVVERNFPLRGEVVISDRPFSSDFTSWESVTSGPPPGEIWVEERLLPLLDIELGDRVDIGRADLVASKVLISEPDSGTFSSFIGARVLMNRADLERSAVIQPGSRITYQLLLAGDSSDVASFRQWAENGGLAEGYRMSGPERAERSLERTISRGRSFLMLAGSIGVMLAGIALAMASRRYTERHVDQVALWKSWGESKQDIRRLYLSQLLILVVLSTLSGLLLGWILQEGLHAAIKPLIPQPLPAPALAALWTGAVTGPLCLAGFAVPAFWRLLDVSPLQMLRRDMPFNPVGGTIRFVIGLATIFAIIVIYGGQLDLAGMFASGLLVLIGLTAIISLLLLKLGRSIGHRLGSIWRLALNSLWRRKGSTAVQLVAFGATLMLLLVLFSVRTSLIEEWRLQLAPEAPNHFLVNIASWELEGVEQEIADSGLDVPDMYPMVRGRLISINDRVLSDQEKREAEVSRELNLTAARELPVENVLVEGEWWRPGSLESGLSEPGENDYVSVELETATALGLRVGDQVSFDIGGVSKSAEVASIRDLNWESMTPNFYFIFHPRALDDFAVSYMTSVYVPPDQRRFVSDLLREHPTVLVIAIDQIIEQLSRVVSQITGALQLMLAIILACGFLVLFSAVTTSLSERMKEAAILRVLGGSRNQIFGTLSVEFISLGFIAGLTAAVGAELVTTQVQFWLLDMTPAWHPEIWMIGPIAGALLIGLLGLWSSRSVVTASPLQTITKA